MAGLSLRDLALFVAVVDAGSITAGAHAEGMSLSSASARISGLETRQGVVLLRRNRGGVVPTVAGEAFAVHARLLLQEAGELDRAMGRFRDGPAELIRVVSNTSAVDALTEFLAASLARFATMRITVAETTSADAAARLREGNADIGVVSALPEPNGITSRELWADPLVIVARAPRSARSAVTFDEAIRSPLVGLAQGSPLQTLIDGQARALGVTPVYRVRLPTLEAVYAVASTGAGAAIIPLGTAHRLRAAPAIVHPIEEGWAKRQARLITRTSHRVSPLQQTFIDALLSYRDEEHRPDR